MGYLSSDRLQNLTEKELSLVKRMWNVLIQAILSNNLTTLSSIKRFIFVIEGLTINQDEYDDNYISKKLSVKASKHLKTLFSEFKPLYLNRLAK